MLCVTAWTTRDSLPHTKCVSCFSVSESAYKSLPLQTESVEDECSAGRSGTRL